MPRLSGTLPCVKECTMSGSQGPDGSGRSSRHGIFAEPPSIAQINLIVWCVLIFSVVRGCDPTKEPPTPLEWILRRPHLLYVRRQSFWDSGLVHLREALARLLGDVKRPADDAASVDW
jgi:hypothetical protein